MKRSLLLLVALASCVAAAVDLGISFNETMAGFYTNGAGPFSFVWGFELRVGCLSATCVPVCGGLCAASRRPSRRRS
jgi:hypothetical protein